MYVKDSRRVEGRSQDQTDFNLTPLFFCPGTTNLRAINSDPIRGLIADMTKTPKAVVPAPLGPKDPPAGYSYQQINCLDSIIRFACKPAAWASVVSFSFHQSTHPVILFTGTWRAVTFLTLLKGSVAPPLALPPQRPTTTNSRKLATATKVLTLTLNQIKLFYRE